MLKSTAKIKGSPDYILIGICAILLILSILILASASAPISQEKFGKSYYFLNHQLLFGFLPGLILAFLAFRINLAILKKWAPILFLINLILLVMVFLPEIGGTAGGATRWLILGSISFQPSEFLKLTLILYLAAWLTTRTPLKSKFDSLTEKKFDKTLLAFLILVGIIGLLLTLQPNVGTFGIIFAIALLIYFLASTPLWHTILIISIGVVSFFSLIRLAPYRMERILVFFNPETDPMGIGYQIKQAQILIGSGRIFGQGLGTSVQNILSIPHAISDSIFVIFTQETGFVGSLILISLFLLFFWRGFRIGKMAADKFSQLISLGITFWICLQAFVNISSMVGILPLAGIPLPFISYGGSHLIAELTGIGLLLNVSKNTS